MKRWMPCLLLAVLTGVSPLAASAATVTDDTSAAVRLDAPARRIVSLAPPATEMLFAIGAGEHVVGAVSYSDYPAEAREIPRVGSYDAVDYERILALEPDLVVAWASGNGRTTLERLRELGLTVFVTEPRALADIPATMERLGALVGGQTMARDATKRFRRERARLARHYRGAPKVSVFFQIWHGPMMTVNGEHLISRVIELCGGRNVFGELRALVPRVGTEAVIAADPEAIVAAGRDANRPHWLNDWRQWESITAVARGNLFHLDPDLIHRASPRIIEGARMLCEALQIARERRP